MNTIKVDVRGQNCPVPVVEVRKALRNAKPGDIVEIIGTNELSKSEVPMVIEAAGKKIEKIMQYDNEWKMIVKC